MILHDIGNSNLSRGYDHMVLLDLSAPPLYLLIIFSMNFYLAGEVVPVWCDAQELLIS